MSKNKILIIMTIIIKAKLLYVIDIKKITKKKQHTSIDLFRNGAMLADLGLLFVIL